MKCNEDYLFKSAKSVTQYANKLDACAVLALLLHGAACAAWSVNFVVTTLLAFWVVGYLVGRGRSLWGFAKAGIALPWLRPLMILLAMLIALCRAPNGDGETKPIVGPAAPPANSSPSSGAATVTKHESPHKQPHAAHRKEAAEMSTEELDKWLHRDKRSE